MDLELCFVLVVFSFLFPMTGIIETDPKGFFFTSTISHNWTQSMRYIRYACISRQHPMRSIKQTRNPPTHDHAIEIKGRKRKRKQNIPQSHSPSSTPNPQ